MALSFSLTLPADTTFISVGDIPELTAGAIYPPSDSESELTDSGFDLQELRYAACQTEHEKILDRAIDDGMVTLLNKLSFAPHTFPFGAARKRSVISIDDFKRFAAILQIAVVVENESEIMVVKIVKPKEKNAINQEPGIDKAGVSKPKQLEPPGKLPPVAIGKMAVKAAWEIERATNKRATTKEVMAMLQAWADNGAHPADLLESDKTNNSVLWLTAKGKKKAYDIFACEKTMETWKKSRE